jgi:tetratricopeptide (TPR) repeat protein
MSSQQTNVFHNDAYGDVHTKQTTTREPWWFSLMPPFLLTLITTLFYLPSLYYPFQFDDLANISKKFSIRFDNPLARCFTNSRWISDWLNCLNYKLCHVNPVYYRIFNLAIHILMGLLIFYLVHALCTKAIHKPFLYSHRNVIAFVTSFLFLLHPVQTQTVSYVIQARVEGLASFFVILMLFCFIKLITSPNTLYLLTWGGALALCSFLACGTKELVIIAPVLFILCDWFFISQERWEFFKSHLLFHIIFSVSFLALMVHYLTPQYALHAISLKVITANNRGNIITTTPVDFITPFQFLISEFRVVAHYILMYLWPFNISVEYNWKIIPTIFSSHVIIPFLFLLSIFSSAVYCAIKKQFSFWAFGLFWFFACVAPRSTIIPSPELGYDYKAYLASVGILFICAIPLTAFFGFILKICNYIIINHYKQGILTQPVYFLTTTLLFLPLGVLTLQRNTIWSNEIAFWEDNIKKAPEKARAHNNYGVALSEASRFDEAIKEYKRAIELDKFYSDPFSNIAVAYSLKGQFDLAIEALKSAIVLNPEYAEAYNNLGTLYIKNGNLDLAEKMLNKAIALRGYYGKALYNMGRLYIERKQDEKAWEYFKRATQGDLDTPDGFYTLGQLSLRLNRHQEAVKAFERIIEKGLSIEQVWFGLANAYYLTKDYDKAISIYTRLHQTNPLDNRYIYNLGETYFIKKNYDLALACFKKATTLPKPLPQSFFRTVNCLEQLNRKQEAKNFLQQLLHVNVQEDFKKVVQGELNRLNTEAKTRTV